MTRIRRIAVLVDGGFFLKRLPALVGPERRGTPAQVAEQVRIACKRHVQRLIGEDAHANPSRWLDHVYRLFYYDAAPYDGVSHHPILNRRIEFARSDEASFRQELFSELRRKRKFALRLGKVQKEGDWQFRDGLAKRLLLVRDSLPLLESALAGEPLPEIGADQRGALERLVATVRALDDGSLYFGLRQKGVDMRIGVDIASITLKRQADTIVLVTGDSDFVPAAKLARREGVEFILDPMWQSVSDDLHEHVDGIQSGFPRPGGDPMNANQNAEP